jgi:chromosome segregation ATPase
MFNSSVKKIEQDMSDLLNDKDSIIANLQQDILDLQEAAKSANLTHTATVTATQKELQANRREITTLREQIEALNVSNADLCRQIQDLENSREHLQHSLQVTEHSRQMLEMARVALEKRERELIAGLQVCKMCWPAGM